jgi:hypothetical protein
MWNNALGCLSFCDGEQELQQRRAEEAELQRQLEAERQAQAAAEAHAAHQRTLAEQRTNNCPDARALRNRQYDLMKRFFSHMGQARWNLWVRQTDERYTLKASWRAKIAELEQEHNTQAVKLEEEQLMTEIEIQAGLDNIKKAQRRLTLELDAYDMGLTNLLSELGILPQVITPADRARIKSELDKFVSTEQLHGNRIHMLRKVQEKQMDKLLAKQKKEMDQMRRERHESLGVQLKKFSDEEDVLNAWYQARAVRMRARWMIECEMYRLRKEGMFGVNYARPSPPRARDYEHTSEEERLVMDNCHLVHLVLH